MDIFSANKYHPDRTRVEVLVTLTDFAAKVDDLDGARDWFCGTWFLSSTGCCRGEWHRAELVSE
jgi:hypothetical protein